MFVTDFLVVSIVMPAYNAVDHIVQAIQSVLAQTYPYWELLIVNDGSTDDTEAKVKSFSDSRIQYFKQNNLGVSAARNVGLVRMKGDFFCFLDADDTMPPRSIESRLEVFAKNEALSFVDGKVLVKDSLLRATLRCYVPSFKGDPLPKLLRLSSQCFLGNTWMIKRNKQQIYRFLTETTHSEDLLFYISIATEGKLYSYTEEKVLYYRQTETSSMRNLRGLEEGYAFLYNTLKSKYITSNKKLLYVKFKITRIMTLSYIQLKRDFISALRVFLRYMML